jgi:hypothetical protein
LTAETASSRTGFLCRPAFLWTLVAIGAALRIFQYASDTSFWFDELSLVRNIVHMSEAQLATEPLRYDQVAPVGFLVAEKAISRALGESDLAFRALLLPVGLAALVLFVPLARRLLDGYAVPFAVAMFAIGAPFIRYCAEVKQYGIDMASVIAMSLVTLRLRDPDADTGARCVAAGLLGAVLVWFSQATILILAGLGGALLLAWLIERDAPTARALRIAVPIWAAACVAGLVVAQRLVSSSTQAFMDQFWRLRGGFPPWPIRKAGDLVWPWNRVRELFAEDMLLRYPWPALYAVLAGIGLIVLWRRRRAGAFVLLGPFAAAVFASVAQQYPFRARLVLYLAPAFVLVVAQAAESLRAFASRWHPALGFACLAALFAGPASSFVRFPPPYFVEDHKSVLAYVREHRQPGDVVFVYPYEIEAVERYGAEYGLAPGDYEVGQCSKNDRRAFLRDVDRYRGRARVWFIGGAVPPFQPPRQTVEAYLSTIGVPLRSIVVPGARPIAPVSAILFDLSDRKRLEAASAETFPMVKPPAGSPMAFPLNCGTWVEPLSGSVLKR